MGLYLSRYLGTIRSLKDGISEESVGSDLKLHHNCALDHMQSGSRPYPIEKRGVHGRNSLVSTPSEQTRKASTATICTAYVSSAYDVHSVSSTALLRGMQRVRSVLFVLHKYAARSNRYYQGSNRAIRMTYPGGNRYLGSQRRLVCTYGRGLVPLRSTDYTRKAISRRKGDDASRVDDFDQPRS